MTSLKIAAAAAIVSTLLGLGAALALARMNKLLRVPFDALVYLTLVVPEIVIAVASLIFFVQLPRYVPFFPPLGAWTIFFGQVVFGASLAMLIIRARFVGMGDTLEEAGYDLGSGRLSTFRQVTLPRLFPAIIAAALLSFTFSFDDYVAAGVHQRHHQHLADRALLGGPVRDHPGRQRAGDDHAGGDDRRDRVTGLVLRRSRVSALAGDDELAAAPVPGALTSHSRSGQPSRQSAQVPKISSVWLTSAKPCSAAMACVHLSTAGPSTSTVAPQDGRPGGGGGCRSSGGRSPRRPRCAGRRRPVVGVQRWSVR